MNKLLTTANFWHDKFCVILDYLQSPFLLFVRLYWGIQLMQSGWGKLHHLDKVTGYFTSLGLPAPGLTAAAISSLEFFGGLLLVIGLFSRLISFVLTINMIAAYITADRDALLSIFSDPDKFTGAAEYVFLIASLVILIFGAGVFSLDELADRFFWKKQPQSQNKPVV
jgi:putative oxidoreductase